MIYSKKKYLDRVHNHIDRLSTGAITNGSIPVGIKQIDDILVPLAPTDLGVVLAQPGNGKCLGIGTKVIMYDGTTKNVEDVVVGDRLMGPDSTPRNVLSIARGREQMYWVNQEKGMSYRVNESHILSLTNQKMARMGQYINKSIIELGDEYYCDGEKPLKGYKAVINFPQKFGKDKMFVLGVLMGQLYDNAAIILSTESDARKFVRQFHGYRVKRLSPGYLILDDNFSQALSIEKLLSLMGMTRREVYEAVRHSSIEERIGFLKGMFSVLNMFSADELFVADILDKEIVDVFKYAVESLGYSCYRASAIDGYIGMWQAADLIVYRMKGKRGWINRDLSNIKIKKDIVDDYYGFVIDGDHLFLLEDFTVTHNTAFMLSMMFNAGNLYNQDSSTFAPPIYITRETAIEELILRMLANYAGINIKEMKDNSPYIDWNYLHESLDEMIDKYPIIFIGHSMYGDDDRRSLTPQLAIESVKKVHDHFGYPSILVGIDYLQRFTWEDGMAARDSAMKMVDAFKDMALIEKTAVLLGSQAKREVSSRPFPCPTETDGLETSNIEHTADWMLGLMRPAKHWAVGDIVPKSKENIIVTNDLFFINILKQRSGETNIGAWCSFDMRIFQLSDLELK